MHANAPIPTPSWCPFAADLQRELPADALRADPDFVAGYARDVSGFQRSISAVVFPATTSQVVCCVQSARRHRVSLYPVSTGMNWGLGSALPVRDGAVVVDLRRMDRIRQLDCRRGYAVIEPGVSQQALADRLRAEAPAFHLNVTAAPAGHSIIGNALERGVGMCQSQVDLVTVTEAVTGTGEVLTTGLPATAKAAPFYAPGVGPDLSGLFFQSSFAIVTAARVRLLPRPAVLAHVFCNVHHAGDLPDVVDALVKLRQAGAVDTGLHFANPTRSRMALRPALLQTLRQRGWTAERDAAKVADALLGRDRAAWSVATTLRGSPARVRDAGRQLRRALGDRASLRVLPERRIAKLQRILALLSFVPALRKQSALLAALRPLLDLSAGIPSDAPLASTFPDSPTDPGASKRGLLFCLPVVPLDGLAMAEVEAIASRIAGQQGFALSVTFNSIAQDAVESVLGLQFDRTTTEETTRARRCIDQMMQALADAGYPPYRLGIESMQFAHCPGCQPSGTLRAIKDALDPDHVIAPGRYNTT